MSTRAIDYDALAKQAGAIQGPADYDALARQAGAEGNSVAGGSWTPAPPPKSPSLLRDLVGLVMPWEGTPSQSQSFGGRVSGAVHEIGNQAATLAGLISPRAGEAIRNRVGGSPEGPGTGTGRALIDIAEAAELPPPEAFIPKRVAVAAGKYAPLLRIATGAGLGSGLAGVQGGSKTWGAVGGAGGEALGTALRVKVAPSVAEAGAGVRAAQRQYGRGAGRLGDLLLNATEGRWTNKGITTALNDRIDALDSARMALAQRGEDSGLKVSLRPARARLAQSIAERAAGNAPAGPVQPVYDRLMTAQVPGMGVGVGEALPESVSPVTALRMRQGLSQDFSTWQKLPGSHPLQGAASEAAEREINNEQARVLGHQFGDMGREEGALIGLRTNLAKKALGPGLAQRVVDRGAARTGALTPMLVAGKMGGAPAMLAAPLVQELVTAPGALMKTAKAMRTAAPLVRPAVMAGASLATQKR